MPASEATAEKPVEKRALSIVGAGGHATVVADAWRSAGGIVASFFDDSKMKLGQQLMGASVAGRVDDAAGCGDPLHLGIGDNDARRRVAERLHGCTFPMVRHAQCVISSFAEIGPGVLVAAAAVLQVGCRIRSHTIVNTGAIVEHDCMIGDFVHLAPGSRLGGGVRVDEGAFIGTGAIILPGLRIGAGALVGAGAVVLRDVASGSTVVGNPARTL